MARFCQRHLPAQLAKCSSHDVGTALVSTFHRMDDMLREPDRVQELYSLSRGLTNPQRNGPKPWSCSPDWIGCTAIVCCVRADSIIVANAGDSRAVLCRAGQAVPLSEDHKPNAPGERERISNAGGSVLRQQIGHVVQFRVNGNLNLSRSIGDLEYKRNADLTPSEQMICSTPDVHVFPREQDDEFIILACDGVWDVVGSQDAVDFITDRLPRTKSSGSYVSGTPGTMEDAAHFLRDRFTGVTSSMANNDVRLSGIMEELLDHCLSSDLSSTCGLGGDNMTAMLVMLNHTSRSVGVAGRDSTRAELHVFDSTDMETGRVEDVAVLPGKGWLCGPAKR